jgi:hypothetical protein
MTSNLQSAIEKVKLLSPHRQDEIAEMMLALSELDNSSIGLTRAQQDEVQNRIAQKIDLVPESEMNDFFHKLVG